MNTRTTTAGFVAALATAAALVAGCTNGNDNDGHQMGSMGSMGSMMNSAPMSAEDNASDHNTADVMWTQMMIPHHRQAVEMAALAEGRTDNAQLLALAEQIAAAQGPEIAQMTDWLTAWGVPTMMGSDTDHPMPDTSMGMGMGGMMSAEQMAELENSTGAEFDRAWLEMMIAHHQGAIEMSEQIRTDGSSEQVRDLAGKIVTGQQAEIEQMQSMLGR